MKGVKNEEYCCKTNDCVINYTNYANANYGKN